MSRAPKFTAELYQLCGKLRDGEITQAESARLSEMLRDSRAARQFYRTFMALASALETRTCLQSSVDQEADSDKNIEVLFDLLRMEQEAEVIELPHEPVAITPRTHRRSEKTLDWREVADVSGYLLTQACKSGPGKWLAAAAVILLAASLFIVLSGNGESPNSQPPIVATPGEPNNPPPTISTVATLTATHNAQWAGQSTERALVRGSKMRAGQRLTLTQGFAEITTNDGAIAILEAPVTVELLDNSNALRLHAGKLVGICETDASKDFLVLTPHMDITDLGTRFGVDLTHPLQTAVHVIDGRVGVAWQVKGEAQIQREEVRAGDAMAADRDGVAQWIAYEPHRFVSHFEDAKLRPNFADSNAIWQGQLTGDLRQDKREADALQVFLERHDLMLSQVVEVDFDRKHDWDPQAGVGLRRVTAGQRVDVYLLHFDLVNGHENPEELLVDFGRPILGVIVSQATLDKTDASLGVDSVTYPVFFQDPLKVESEQSKAGYGPRGLNNRSIQSQEDADPIAIKDDLASISPDGTTLKLRLWGGEAGVNAKMDQVRVLVRSERVLESR